MVVVAPRTVDLHASVGSVPSQLRPRAQRRHGLVLRAAAETQTQVTEVETNQGNKAKIYIGHEKEDYEGRRTGKPGRFIEDDPTLYPGKEDVGFLAGATGGWAGGEAGLKQFIEEYKKAEAPAPKKEAPKVEAKEMVPTVTGKKAPVTKVEGKDLIYVGYGKDDLELRKSGAPGAFIKADARKYPGKEDIGPFANAVGGFAGGELGLQQFVTEGDVKIAEDGSARRQGPSTLLIAGVVAVAGTVGGLTLTQATNFSQELAASGSGSALDVLDDNTKLLLQAAIVLIGITAGLAGTRAAFKAMTDSVTENALNLVCGFFDKGVVKPYGRHTNLPTPQAKVTVFWIVVFLAARFVLQS